MSPLLQAGARRRGRRASTDWIITAVRCGEPAASATRWGSGTVPTETPSQPRRTAPKRRIWPTTKATVLAAIAKQMPWAPRMTAVLTPIDLAGRGGERAAGVARVERGVGLDHVLDRAAGAAGERAAERRDDARRSPSPGSRTARRSPPRSGPGAAGALSPRRAAARPAGVGAQHREVGVGVAAEHARRRPRGRRRSGRVASRAPATTWWLVTIEAVRATAPRPSRRRGRRRPARRPPGRPARPRRDGRRE